MNLILKNKKRLWLCFILFITGIAFFVQDYWFISDWDDIFYKFICTNQSMGYVPQLKDGHHQFIQTFSDVLYSQWNHYFGSNGRFIVHTIVQSCTSFLSPHKFAFLNSVIFAFLIAGITRCGDKKIKISNCLFCISAIIILAPQMIGSFFANMAWSVNYLWSATINVFWLILYEKETKNGCKLSLTRILFYSIISIIAGSFQESFSIGICAGLGIYNLIYIKKLTWNRFLLAFSYFIGACTVIFSPANFKKAEGKVSGFNIDAILDLISVYSFILLLLLLLICIVIVRKRAIQFLKDNILLISIVIFSLFFCIFFVYNGWRQYTIVNLLSVVLLIRLLSVFDVSFVRKCKYTFIFISIIICASCYSSVYTMRKSLGVAYYSIVENAVNNKSRIIFDHDYEIARYKIEHSFYNKYFVINSINGEKDSHCLSILISNGKDMNYIDAVLPVSLKNMELICLKTKDKANVAHLYNCTYALASNEFHKTENVIWNFNATFRNPKKFHKCFLEAMYKLSYNGRLYYIFENNSNNIVSESIIFND